MVTCPICRTRFPYRAATATVPAPAREEAREELREESWNDEPSAAPAPPVQPRERPNRLVNANYVPKGSKKQTVLILSGFTLASITVLAVIMISMKGHKWFGNDGPSGPKYTDENFNFRFNNFEPEKWRQDVDRRDPFGMNGFLYQQREKDSDPDAWIGMRCVRFGDKGNRAPREGELEKEVDLVLRNMKLGGVQKVPAQTTIGNQSATGYTFNGNMQDTAVWGEVYGFHNKGIGYIITIWATESKWKSAQKELVAMRDSFEFADGRKDWKDVGGQSRNYFVDGGDYQLEDTFELWQRAIPEEKQKGDYVRDVTDEDDNATMLFRCRHPDDRLKDPRQMRYPADAVVLVLPKVGDSAQDVSKHVLDTLTKKHGSAIKFEAYPNAKPPFEFKTPSSAANIGYYKLTHPADRDFKFFYVIAAKKINGQTVAVVGWCREPISELMGPHIVRFAATLKDRQ